MRVCVPLFIALIACATNLAKADHYAVLVSGSKGYENYRHQADICHAFQLVSKKGNIPTDNIITMLFDDIASSPRNPFPGKLFNKPSQGEGVDVYENCQKDYTGHDVTVKNFINVLTGNAEAMSGVGNGKVLKSGPNDRVFIYYADHGGLGVLEMPGRTGESLYADQLNDALNTMHQKNMYKELVFYIDACESGSMFEKKLPDNINVFATTSARANQNAWSFYCGGDATVNGKSIGSCLGDVYSVSWMEDSDGANFEVETLADQFEKVKMLTANTRPGRSDVLEFGDLSLGMEPIGNFQGTGDVDKQVCFDFSSEPSIEKCITCMGEAKAMCTMAKCASNYHNFDPKEGICSPSTCFSWRATGNCNATVPPGYRDPVNDKSCSATIPSESSGFCECSCGRRGSKGCSGESITCASVCEKNCPPVTAAAKRKLPCPWQRVCPAKKQVIQVIHNVTRPRQAYDRVDSRDNKLYSLYHVFTAIHPALEASVLDKTSHSLFDQYIGAAPGALRGSISDKLIDEIRSYKEATGIQPFSLRVSIVDELVAEIRSREAADKLFQDLTMTLIGKPASDVERHNPVHFDCHRKVVQVIESSFGGYTDYSLKYHAAVVSLCEMYSGNSKPIVQVLDSFVH